MIHPSLHTAQNSVLPAHIIGPLPAVTSPGFQNNLPLCISALRLPSYTRTVTHSQVSNVYVYVYTFFSLEPPTQQKNGHSRCVYNIKVWPNCGPSSFIKISPCVNSLWLALVSAQLSGACTSYCRAIGQKAANGDQLRGQTEISDDELAHRHTRTCTQAHPWKLHSIWKPTHRNHQPLQRGTAALLSHRVMSGLHTDPFHRSVETLQLKRDVDRERERERRRKTKSRSRE